MHQDVPNPTTQGSREDRPSLDQQEIDALINRFFSVFDNRNRRPPALDGLYQLCLAQCVIVKTCGNEPEIYDLAGFIEPRQQLLGDGGSLVEFSEWEVRAETTIVGDIAQRQCVYEKSGVFEGRPFSARGFKNIQLVRTGAGWRISAAAWDDERPGVKIP